MEHPKKSTSPVNRFVATFIGNTNLLEGTISQGKHCVETLLGCIPAAGANQFVPGEQVLLSIRPDSMQLHKEGPIQGKLKSCTYTGETIEARVMVDVHMAAPIELKVHIHPEELYQEGDCVRIRIMPGFPAVIRP